MRTTAVLPAILIALLTLSTPTPAARAQAPSPKFEQIAALIAQKMAEYGVPGVAFGVLKDGQLLTRGFGVTNLDDVRPVTPDTIFPIASISKTFTATAVMRLVEQGKLELGGPFLLQDAGGMMVATKEVSQEELEIFAATDPAVQSGLLLYEVRPWLTAMEYQ